MAKGNKPEIHTTIDRETDQQIKEMISMGAFSSKSSLLVEAIDKLYREQTKQIQLHPKAAKAVTKAKRSTGGEYNYEQVANQLIINSVNQSNNDKNS